MEIAYMWHSQTGTDTAEKEGYSRKIGVAVKKLTFYNILISVDVFLFCDVYFYAQVSEVRSLLA